MVNGCAGKTDTGIFIIKKNTITVFHEKEVNYDFSKQYYFTCGQESPF